MVLAISYSVHQTIVYKLNLGLTKIDSATISNRSVDPPWLMPGIYRKLTLIYSAKMPKKRTFVTNCNSIAKPSEPYIQTASLVTFYFIKFHFICSIYNEIVLHYFTIYIKTIY